MRSIKGYFFIFYFCGELTKNIRRIITCYNPALINTLFKPVNCFENYV